MWYQIIFGTIALVALCMWIFPIYGVWASRKSGQVAIAVAESIKLIGNSLEENTNYLKWQWIKSMADTENELIYVPTEAGLPILEAGRKAPRNGALVEGNEYSD